MTTKRYRISAAARKAGIPECTLREYHKRGIIAPERDAKGRLFSDADLRRAQQHRLRHGLV